MRILHLNQFGSYRGGAEGYIADAARALQRDGHHSHLVSFTPDGPGAVIDSVSYVPLSEWSSAVDEAMAAIEAIIEEQQPDVAYLHTVYHPTLVARLAQRLPSVAYIHGPYPVCPGSAQYLRKTARVCPHTAGAICLVNAQLEKCCWGRNPKNHWRLLRRTRQFAAAYRSLCRIMVGSRFMQQLMIRGGVPADKISLLAPVLLDASNLPEAEPGEPGTILFAGRVTPEKGLKHLIQALAMADNRWHLLVAGEGPELETCRALSRQLNIADKIEFLGWADPAKMKFLYQRCAVVAVPSLWPEPFGRVGPEAFVHGKPVVAYAIGGVPDWLDDGATGYLVAPGDLKGLGQRLNQLLEAPDRCRQMGRQARSTALTRWNTENHLKQLMSTFDEAIKD